MDPRLRTFLFGLVASIVACWVGVSLANENIVLVVLCACVCLWAIVSWTFSGQAEGWLLGFLLFGYIVGNRGFAQLNLVPGMPLFLGELGLALGGSLLLIRSALGRTLPFENDALNKALLAWIVISLARLPLDFLKHGFLAVRDVAMIYYAAYFFIAQRLARDVATMRFLSGALTASFVILPPVALAYRLLPEFFLGQLTVRGSPLVFLKGDLVSASLFAGFIWLTLGQRSSAKNKFLHLMGMFSLVMGLTELSRASIVGLFAGLAIVSAGRDWRPTRLMLVACIVGFTGLSAVETATKSDFTQTKVYAIYEHLASIFDFSGTREYKNQETSDSGDNNRYRLVWWKSVARETISTGPLFGLGFGHDLAFGFLREYYPAGDDEFTVRSPHSMMFSVLGRTGVVGLACWLAVIATLARQVWRVARGPAATTEEGRQATRLYAMAWVILIAAWFGVVLEGPMGAITFWTILGLAHETGRIAQIQSEPVQIESTTTPAGSIAA